MIHTLVKVVKIEQLVDALPTSATIFSRWITIIHFQFLTVSLVKSIITINFTFNETIALFQVVRSYTKSSISFLLPFLKYSVKQRNELVTSQKFWQYSKSLLVLVLTLQDHEPLNQCSILKKQITSYFSSHECLKLLRNYCRFLVMNK